jgi:hypothetical protein
LLIAERSYDGIALPLLLAVGIDKFSPDIQLEIADYYNDRADSLKTAITFSIA